MHLVSAGYHICAITTGLADRTDISSADFEDTNRAEVVEPDNETSLKNLQLADNTMDVNLLGFIQISKSSCLQNSIIEQAMIILGKAAKADLTAKEGNSIRLLL